MMMNFGYAIAANGKVGVDGGGLLSLLLPTIVLLIIIYFAIIRPLQKSIKKNPQYGSVIALGIIGFLIGGFIGFLSRPSAFLVGQLPFSIVILRGSSLTGMDAILKPIAQQSFNIMMAGSIIGALTGSAIAYFILRSRSDNIYINALHENTTTSGEDISIEDEVKKCPACAETIKLEAKKCRFCGEIFDQESVQKQIKERRGQHRSQELPASDQIKEETAQVQLERAIKSETSLHFDKAILLYKEIMQEFPGTQAAKDAKISLDTLQKKMNEET
ncbi:MAG: hypothetical protein QME81_15310 [bacterium]|nr:hypothetical protein [bacterium]